jgi:hypothetical protein
MMTTSNSEVISPMVGPATALLLAVVALVCIASLVSWCSSMLKRVVHRAQRDALPPLPSRAVRRRLARIEVKRQQGNVMLYSTIDERSRASPGTSPVKL